MLKRKNLPLDFFQGFQDPYAPKTSLLSNASGKIFMKRLVCVADAAATHIAIFSFNAATGAVQHVDPGSDDACRARSGIPLPTGLV